MIYYLFITHIYSMMFLKWFALYASYQWAGFDLRTFRWAAIPEKFFFVFITIIIINIFIKSSVVTCLNFLHWVDSMFIHYHRDDAHLLDFSLVLINHLVSVEGALDKLLWSEVHLILLESFIENAKKNAWPAIKSRLAKKGPHF